MARGRRLHVVVLGEPSATIDRLRDELAARGHEASVGSVMGSPLDAVRAELDRPHDARVIDVAQPGALELLSASERPRPTLVVVPKDDAGAALEALRVGAAAVLLSDAPPALVTRALDALLAPLELRASEDEWTTSKGALAEAIPTAVLLAQDGVIVSANRALARLLGLEPASLPGRPVSDLVDPDDADLVQRRALMAAAWTGAAKLRDTRVEARLLMAPCARMGRPAVHVVIQDLSPEARTSRELAEFRTLSAERRELVFLGSLVQSVVHDLRNPLQAAMFGLSALKACVASGKAPSGEPVALLERKVREIDAILAELHECAQPWRLTRLPFPLHELLGGAETTLREAAREREVTLKVEVDDARFDVAVDPPRLKQALLNIMRASIEASPPGGVVLVRAGATDDLVWIEVDDQRQAPPEEGVDSEFAAGAGRGARRRLAISRRIIEAHDGTLRLERRTAGARARLELPAAARVKV
jgi:PAS domain S-box-containing protein